MATTTGGRKRSTRDALLGPREAQPAARANPAEIKEASRFRAMCAVFEDPRRCNDQPMVHKTDTVRAEEFNQSINS